MKQPEYRSVFSTFINDFIAYKRAGGYKYISEAVYLKQFDDYCCSLETSSPVLTKELMDSWCKKKTYEAERYSWRKTLWFYNEYTNVL